MKWIKAATSADVERKPVVFKHPPRQIAVFKTNGKVFAVDNRCPHEGYPLAEGDVNGECVLTCNWHNWKFRLQDGKCTLGGDDVRTYAAKEQDGFIWVNVSDPPKGETEQHILEGLHVAFVKRDFGRICREITRLHYEGLDPLLAFRKALEWSYDKFEFGTTHAIAASADWLALYAENDGDWEKQLICLAEAVDHLAWDALRQPAFPFPKTARPFHKEEFLKAVESEDREVAEAMLLGAARWADVEEACTEAALAHYNDFGHSLIYVYKTGQLISQLGESSSRWLLPPLARHLCYTTREDLIPEFRSYRPILGRIQPQKQDRSAEITTPFPASLSEALAWLEKHYCPDATRQIYDALLDANARNWLHFDAQIERAYDNPVGANVGWLDFTHAVTFANAVRRQCDRFPKLWPAGLLQMACFLGRNKPFIDTEIDETPWFIDDEDRFWAESFETIYDHGQRDPIFSAHFVKTALAVREELPTASPSCRRYMLAALDRFLHSPIKQKHVRRLARQAISLVKRDYV